MKIDQVSVEKLRQRMQSEEDLFLLDVREPFEVELASIEGAISIPMGEILQRLEEIPRDCPSLSSATMESAANRSPSGSRARELLHFTMWWAESTPGLSKSIQRSLATVELDLLNRARGLRTGTRSAPILIPPLARPVSVTEAPLYPGDLCSIIV